METTYTVMVSYFEDTEYVELAEGQDREALWALARLISAHAHAEISGVWVVGDDGSCRRAYCDSSREEWLPATR